MVEKCHSYYGNKDESLFFANTLAKSLRKNFTNKVENKLQDILRWTLFLGNECYCILIAKTSKPNWSSYMLEISTGTNN